MWQKTLKICLKLLFRIGCFFKVIILRLYTQVKSWKQAIRKWILINFL